MASSVDIKVKHGDTLRRFNTVVTRDNNLDLNMDELRMKVRSLFNFPADANFTLTYIDEDNDRVTLADDDDLRDVVRQSLNPVRITVHLNTEKSLPSSASSISSGPSSSSPQILDQNLNCNISEVLKSVPEPLRDAVSRLSLEVAAKAASTSPKLADIVESLAKFGQSCLNVSKSSSNPGARTNHHDEVCDNREHTSVGEKLNTTSNGLESNNSGFRQPASESTQMPDVVGAVKGVEPSRPPFLPSFTGHEGRGAKIDDCAAKSWANQKANLLKNQLPKGHWEKKLRNAQPEVAPCGVRSRPIMELKACHPEPSANIPQCGGNKCASIYSLGDCPFTALPLPPRHDEGIYVDPVQAFHDSYSKDDGMGSIFHRGVRCDGCGVLPITGSRFKSKVKHDFDLCSICFARMGNDADYTRIDFPMPYRHPWSTYAFHDSRGGHLNHMKFPHIMRPYGPKHLRSRLDSRFLMDVNVMDGTMMAPSTPFTKIWRMRNNGILSWSRGLQLHYIGGDRFSASDSVEIEFPLEGVNVGKELDVSVDFVAPELPGRYISYWRMADPSGHKFGQRVWVLIQVDATLSDSTCESFPTLNLNVPPEGTGVHPVLDVNVKSSLDAEAGDPNSASDVDKSSAAKQNRRVEIEDLNFPINDDLLVANDVSCAASTTASSSVSPPAGVENPPVTLSASFLSHIAATAEKPVCLLPSSVSPHIGAESPMSSIVSTVPIPPVTFSSYPAVDIDVPCNPMSAPTTLYPLVNMPIETSASSSNSKEDQKSLEQDKAKIEVEESMLKELEDMGFKQAELNKEILRMNEYDLERSLDDLCGVSGWDPILEELKEMGFHDKETNQKLLVKNNGSIMRVVMDLIAGDKA